MLMRAPPSRCGETRDEARAGLARGQVLEEPRADFAHVGGEPRGRAVHAVAARAHLEPGPEGHLLDELGLDPHALEGFGEGLALRQGPARPVRDRPGAHRQHGPCRGDDVVHPFAALAGVGPAHGKRHGQALPGLVQERAEAALVVQAKLRGEGGVDGGEAVAKAPALDGERIAHPHARGGARLAAATGKRCAAPRPRWPPPGARGPPRSRRAAHRWRGRGPWISFRCRAGASCARRRRGRAPPRAGRARRR